MLYITLYSIFLPFVFGIRIKLDDGLIEGVEEYTLDEGYPFYAFRGIPYAEPPLGDLRWRAPRPHRGWSGILNATTDGPSCISFHSLKLTGSEDCLTINVYRAAKKGCPRYLPVMVYVHGGAFYWGSSEYKDYGPDFFLNHCICYVSMNYRLGLFGFMSTEDNVVPGNYGLKDQRLALQWVQRNIKKFGCDKNNVLLFGQSAGAASVSFLTQSKSTKGLFHKAIIQSGSSLCPWAKSNKIRALTLRLADKLNIRSNDSRVIVKALRQIDASSLLRRAAFILGKKLVVENIMDVGVGFAPVTEMYSEEAIVTGYTYENLLSGKSHAIPMIIGFNPDEGLILEDHLAKSYRGPFELFTKMKTTSVIPQNVEKSVYLERSISRRYFLDNQTQTENFLNYVTKVKFHKPILKHMELQSKISNVYGYRFSYRSNYVRTQDGVGHSDELYYQFRYHEWENKVTSFHDKMIRKLLCTLWTNMAYTGNPTKGPSEINLDWNKIHGPHINLLDINENIKMIRHFDKEEIEYWEDIYQEYGTPPFDTY